MSICFTFNMSSNTHLFCCKAKGQLPFSRLKSHCDELTTDKICKEKSHSVSSWVCVYRVLFVMRQSWRNAGRLLRIRFIFIFLKHVFVYVCMCSCRCWRSPEEGVRSPEPGVPSSCEPINVNADSQTQVLWRAVLDVNHRYHSPYVGSRFKGFQWL